MDYSFDKTITRAATNSFKWRAPVMHTSEKELYPMWVADMDFNTSPHILQNLQARISEGIFGYELLSENYYSAIKHWLSSRHNCSVQNDNILYSANCMVGISVILQAFTNPGDQIMLNTPIYGNFFTTINGCGRKIIDSPLIRINNRFTFDFKDMEEKVTPYTRAILISNPHNPTGTVWTLPELELLCEFCKKHQLFIISDEVHFDFVFKGTHTMSKLVADVFHVPSFTIISPGKSFNVAGIQTAAIVTTPEKIKILGQQIHAMSYPFEHSFAEAVTIGAYKESDDWLNEVYTYIKENKEFTISFLERNIPILDIPKSDSTYLLWVNCEKMNIPEDSLVDFWIHECKILPSDGREFGDSGKNYIRLNLACPKKNLHQVLSNIKEAFQKNNYV